MLNNSGDRSIVYSAVLSFQRIFFVIFLFSCICLSSKFSTIFLFIFFREHFLFANRLRYLSIVFSGLRWIQLFRFHFPFFLQLSHQTFFNCFLNCFLQNTFFFAVNLGRSEYLIFCCSLVLTSYIFNLFFATGSLVVFFLYFSILENKFYAK